MARGLNQELRGFPDGAHAGGVELTHYDTTKRYIGHVYVFWPFVTFQTERRCWNITHAPTGCWVSGALDRARAVALIRKLRRIADFEFTARIGRKAMKAKRAANRLLPRFERIS